MEEEEDVSAKLKEMNDKFNELRHKYDELTVEHQKTKDINL